MQNVGARQLIDKLVYLGNIGPQLPRPYRLSIHILHQGWRYLPVVPSGVSGQQPQFRRGQLQVEL